MDKKKLYESAQELRKLGRNQDTILAHINPREAAILKSLGGSGEINPNTGLPEFDDWGWGGFGGFDSWYTPYVAPSYDFSIPSYSTPSYSAPTIDYSSSWQGTPGSNAGAFGGITNTPEYLAMGTTDPITSYVNTPVNMGDPYNLISGGPSYSANQNAFGNAIDYLYNDLGYTGDLGATTAPPPEPTGPSQTVDTSFLDDYLSPEQPTTPTYTSPLDTATSSGTSSPNQTTGGLDFGDTSDALTGGVNIGQDLVSGALPDWSLPANEEAGKQMVDEVVKDVFKYPDPTNQPGRATNGMTMKQLMNLQEAGFGSTDISDTQTVDQAIASMKLSQMKPGQALGLMSGIVTGNPFAIASSIASIAGENKVAQAIGVAANLVSGNTMGALSGLARLGGQNEVANVLGIANALQNGNAAAVAQIAANMTGNRDIAATVNAVNAIVGGNPMQIAMALMNAQPTLSKLASGELFDTIGRSTIAANDPTGDIGSAYQYAGSNPSFNFDSLLSNLSSNFGIDTSMIPGIGFDPLAGAGFTPTEMQEQPVASTPERTFTTAFNTPFTRGNLGDPFDWSKYFPKSKPPMIINAPEDQAALAKKEEPTAAEKQAKAVEQIFGSLDPAMRNILIERGFGSVPVVGLHASGGTIQDSMNSVIKSLTPEFGPASSLRGGLPGGSRKQAMQLAQLQQMRPSIVPPMARGGLPSKYEEAAPEGHKPEFVTGLTGYYAGGRGTGQSDDIPAMLHDGDYVIDAEAVSALGDGSSKAGKDALTGFMRQVPHRDGAEGKPVPARIADGEFVLPASFVTALGSGDNKRGAKMLDAMRERLREHKRSAPTSKIPPKALSPLDYLKKAK